MDLGRLRAGEWVAASSGALLVISLWLPWWEIAGGGSASAWEVLSVLDVLLAALGVAAIALWLGTASGDSPAQGVVAEALLTPVALVVAIACLVRVLNLPGDLEPLGDAAERAAGAWLGLAATLGVLGGILVGMRDERLGEPDDSRVELIPAPPAT